MAIGVNDLNAITDDVFHTRHPERRGARLRSDERALVTEWLDIRDRLVRPALTSVSTTSSAAKGADNVALGTLVADVPGRARFSYRFTRDDLETTARLLINEAGGVDNAENRGTLWAMLNRYAFFRAGTPRWGSFGNFLRLYSQTLGPSLRHATTAKPYVDRCNATFDNPGCNFQPSGEGNFPGTNVPRGQLRTFLAVQTKTFQQLPEAARSLATRLLRGEVPNPVGNATDVHDTNVEFFRKHKRRPTRPEWERFTREFAKANHSVWLPNTGYDQFGHNVLLVHTSAADFPPGVTRIVPA